MLIRTAADLGSLIRERRRRAGLDQRALAERAGVSRQWVVEVEHGKSRAAVGLVLRTLDALGVTLRSDEHGGRRASAPVAAVDLDAVVRAARGGRKR